MPMRVRLTRFAAGTDAQGQTYSGRRGAEVTLTDEDANNLVSAGAAVQLQPFAVTEHTTSPPPWSAEKIAPAADRVKAEAERVGRAAQAQQRAEGQLDAADEAAERAFKDSQPDGDQGATQVVPVGTAPTRDPMTGATGGLGTVVQEGGVADRTAASTPARGSGEDPIGEGSDDQAQVSSSTPDDQAGAGVADEGKAGDGRRRGRRS